MPPNGDDSALRPRLVPQVPSRHVARALASLLEILIGPVDLRLRGAGGVERTARIPVQEHEVAGLSGEGLGHGSVGHRFAGGNKARADLRSQGGATDRLKACSSSPGVVLRVPGGRISRPSRAADGDEGLSCR